jgi:RimJ/RimL family protein N-acetyltransferase
MKDGYIILDKKKYTEEGYSLVPIRWEDRYKIMQWRNDQMYHLRQQTILTKLDQDKYFNDVISFLFDQESPKQLLFSFLKDGECIGYGGLVHLDWDKKTAEISFLINTSLEKTYFKKLWSLFLIMIEKIAFKDLGFLKIYTFSYDLRPQLYELLAAQEYLEVKRLVKEKLVDNQWVDGLFHFKETSELFHRKVKMSDSNILFEWLNEKISRSNSLNKNTISWDEHSKWFNQKINDPNNEMYIFYKFNNVGLLRLENENDKTKISFTVDKFYRGKGIGSKIIETALILHPNTNFIADVLNENISSHKIFLKNKFNLEKNSNLLKNGITQYTKKSSL